MGGVPTLGCATEYDAEIRYRGGGYLWSTIQGLTALKWGRKRDDYSEASISVTKNLAGSACCGRLGNTRTWGHELRIYRDKQVVWEGPIVQITENRATLDIQARDMIAWLDRRELAKDYLGWATAPADTGLIIRTLIADAFPTGNAYADPGLMAYAVLQNTGTKSTTDKLYKSTTTIGEVVRDLIGAGADLFTIGRRLYLLPDTFYTRSNPLRLSEVDFLDELQVQESGLDACTRGVLVGGQPATSTGAPGRPVTAVADAPHPAADFYGLVTTISTSTNTVEDPTQPGNEGVAVGIAKAIVASGFPPPLDIIVPQGARLSPAAPVDIGHLTPGRPFVVLVDSYCRRVEQAFRLNELEVTWNSDEVEQVAASFTSSGPAIQGVTPT